MPGWRAWLFSLAVSILPNHCLAAKVAAAADLQFALAEIVADYSRLTGRQVSIAYGSSGHFARQIAQGAPFDLFISADEEYVLRLAAQGMLRDSGRLYAIGRLALLVPRGSRLTADESLSGLAAAIADGRLRRLAIANPEHAPYGRAARAALQHAGLWNVLQGKLVLGENVAQAAQFALSGSAEGGIVAWSLSLSPELARRSSAALIPAAWHPPIRQRMALTRGAGEAAIRFYDYLQQPAARAVLERHGFALPES
ncbi:MAG TPA: molybdate ABC transporter substrate-binding protein [Accumulibacter sp.]|uniref:molybdate ABC transporter substrate-binding protein n=2 Tax=Accumulibacter sp. TaxID=2053492 RepID=UPI002C9CB248|nr:molybdate ABC transporter substrate-binding protein [Accumulibacter sp.]HMV05980.1 molybdate ABC transporter substrate-binding protein [Accumulibacter sp.]HMW62451.1 molybdate ABC transporter substrate-binding protein [Accumulibacter sp.]HNB66627.1 molybdate ABC transporter substrate-binding protein [Accumulibacter sp.]HNC27738.1 molybdate ABC transporter substrate-binding protein [Accumulibacter sp.]HND37424.1 molybdate ABC transporter substrate-binding protein [Accumulibacter sp.]